MGARTRARNTQLHARTWIQVGGARPDRKILYLSSGEGQFRPAGYDKPISGSDVLNRPSDTDYGEYQSIGKTKSAPELGSISVESDMNKKRLNVLEELVEDETAVAVHMLFGEGNVGDRNNWDSKIVIPFADVDSLGISDVQGQDSDDIHIVTGELSFIESDRAFNVAWDEKIASTVDQPVTGVAFGKTRYHQYAIEKGDGAAVAPKFFYTADNWETSSSHTFTVLTFSQHPNDLAYVGAYLIAPTEADSYVYAQEDDLTTWTEISSGFTASKTPNAIYAPSIDRIIMVGDGGYVYRLESMGGAPTAIDAGVTTANNLNAVDGIGDVIVAGGASNTIIYSTDFGSSFTAVTGPAPAQIVNTIQVVDTEIWFVGMDNGNAYYTVDSGTNWTAMAFSGSGTGNVHTIKFLKRNPAFGLLGVEDASNAAQVFRTTDGGFSWEQLTLTSYPTAQDVLSFAIWDANTMLAGGTGTGGTDGVLALARKTRYTD